MQTERGCEVVYRLSPSRFGCLKTQSCDLASINTTVHKGKENIHLYLCTIS